MADTDVPEEDFLMCFNGKVFDLAVVISPPS